MFATLRPRPPMRRTPRHQPWHRGDVDASRTLRTSLRRMGEPAVIEWRRRGSKPRRVVLLLDVSGSMSGYADALLRLAHRMVVASPRGSVEVFTVGTRLTHLTRALRSRDAERALVRRRRDRAGLVGRHPSRRDDAASSSTGGVGAGWRGARSW